MACFSERARLPPSRDVTIRPRLLQFAHLRGPISATPLSKPDPPACLSGNREQGTGNREQGTGARDRGSVVLVPDLRSLAPDDQIRWLRRLRRTAGNQEVVSGLFLSHLHWRTSRPVAPSDFALTMHESCGGTKRPANSPLKNSFWLRVVETHQLGVAQSRRLCGDVCDSAP